MNKDIISTPLAPQAIGPYSQAIRIDRNLYLSGQIALEPSNGEFCNANFETEVRQIFNNIQGVLTAAGGDFSHLIKLTIYLIDFSDFAALNQLMIEILPTPYPVRTTIAVAALPKGARVEVEAFALI